MNKVEAAVIRKIEEGLESQKLLEGTGCQLRDTLKEDIDDFYLCAERADVVGFATACLCVSTSLMCDIALFYAVMEDASANATPDELAQLKDLHEWAKKSFENVQRAVRKIQARKPR